MLKLLPWLPCDFGGLLLRTCTHVPATLFLLVSLWNHMTDTENVIEETAFVTPAS